ncbi:cyclin-domain-containing protein, partial [Gorgonomyces haynaldii]
YGACEGQTLLEIVCLMLEKLQRLNDTIQNNHLSRFHSRAVPSISLRDYLQRLYKYTVVEPCVLLMLLIFLDRICKRQPNFAFNSLTCHRFLITAIMVGCKTVSDTYATNPYFAKVGGLSVQELNILEIELCTQMDWDFTIDDTILQHYYLHLSKS